MPSAAPPAKGPLPAYRVEMTTNAVMVRTRKVSMNTPIMATTPLLMRGFDLGHGVGMGGGAHTGLVGKQPPLDALADGGL